jgi:hypothetical protein
MRAKQKQPTEKEWKRLYELAAELKSLAPWEWMDETEIFGVENPETKEIGFVSAMGMLGEHLSIGVYLGAKGLYGFWDFQTVGHEADPLALFEIPQLQVSFEDREALEKQDRDVMKKLDLKFRGAQNYPIFRSIHPGFLPWFITSEEAQMLIYVIEQSLEVAPRVRENPKILDDESDVENEVCLVRVAEKQGAKLIWRDEIREIPPPDDEEFTVQIPQELIDALNAFPQSPNLILEIDLFTMPNPVAERGKRPFFPKMLMLADARNGMIAGFQMIEPKETTDEIHKEIAANLIDALQKLEVRPKEIRVADEGLFDTFKGCNQLLNIKLRLTDELRAIDAAREGMFGFLGGLF